MPEAEQRFSASPTRPYSTRSVPLRTLSRRRGSARATWLPSIWAWCPNWPSQCSPVPESALFTRLFLEASRPKPSRNAPETPKAKSSSPVDGGWRRGQIIPLKANVDSACASLREQGHPIQKVVVVQRCQNTIAWEEGRDLRWSELISRHQGDCPCEPMDAEDRLFLLYTSGSTGKPKGIIHTTAGYMVYAYATSKFTFNLVPNQKTALLVHSRYRLGHRTQLHRLWDFGQQSPQPHVRRGT